MVGGSAAALERARPVLAQLGGEPHHLGPVGAALTTKLALNQLIASLTHSFSLSLHLVQRAGVDVEKFMAILRAGRYRSPTLQQPQPGIDVPPALEHKQPSSEPQLTPREQEVLDLIGRGLSDRQIGTSLGLSYETARTYVKTVRRKLGSNNRLAAAAWSWRR